MSDVLEITPFVKFSLDSSKTQWTTGSGITNTVEISIPSLSLGSAFYWHLVRGNTVELSIGPKASATIGFKPELKRASSAGPVTQVEYDKYSNISFDAAANVVLDVKFNSSLIFRTTVTPVSLDLDITSYKREATGTVPENKSTQFRMDTLFTGFPTMSFGLIYMFN